MTLLVLKYRFAFFFHRQTFCSTPFIFGGDFTTFTYTNAKYISLVVNMGIVVTMAKPFIVQIKDDKQRRIVIDKDPWIAEGLQKGDYIEVTIKKITLSG